jgi:hypothetical protein
VRALKQSQMDDPAGLLSGAHRDERLNELGQMATINALLLPAIVDFLVEVSTATTREPRKPGFEIGRINGYLWVLL